MSAQSVPISPPFRSIQTNVETSSTWDRLTTWASENKTVVYAIAGLAIVVTGAGAIYYFSDSNKNQAGVEKRPSKKERRKAKKEKDDAEKGILHGIANSGNGFELVTKVRAEIPSEEDKGIQVTSSDPSELPVVDETTVSLLSVQVGTTSYMAFGC